MADFAMPIPAWLNRDYNPAETFLSAVKTGAAIGETQQRLAEEQRQADLKAQLERESMQNNLLKAQAELAVQQAYRSQQTDLAQQKLSQAQYEQAVKAQESARDFQALQDWRATQEGLKSEQLDIDREKLTQPIYRNVNGVLYEVDRVTGEERAITPPKDVNKPLQATYDPQGGSMTVRGDVDAVTAYKAAQEKALAAEQANKPQADLSWRQRLGKWIAGTDALSGGGSSTNKTSSGLRYEIKQK